MTYPLSSVSLFLAGQLLTVLQEWTCWFFTPKNTGKTPLCLTENRVKISSQFTANQLIINKMAIHKITLTGTVDWLVIDLLNGAHVVLTSKEHAVEFKAEQSQSNGLKSIVSSDRVFIEFNTGGAEPVAFSLALFVETAPEQQQIDLAIDTSHAVDISSGVDQITTVNNFGKVSLHPSSGFTSSATHVIVDDTVWYNYPGQATPPTGELRAGIRVIVLNEAGDYTRIRTEDGSITGYASSIVLAPIAVNPGDDQEALNELEGQTTAESATCSENLPPWTNEPWRTADCLKQLLIQVNALAPTRNKSSDGTIGDLAHQNRTSDHNPRILGSDGKGIVTALDITHDPQRKCDCNVLASTLQANKDARIKYVIWNKRIMNSSAVNGTAPWTWRPYTGGNPHTKHIHISVHCEPAKYDLKTAWNLNVVV